MTIQADPSCGQKRKSRLEDSSEEDIPGKLLSAQTFNYCFYKSD